MDTRISLPIARAALMCLAGFSISCTGGATQEPKPVVENALITEFKAPPPTLNEMILSADAVLVGRLTGARPNDREYPGLPNARVKTLWTLEVREVLHMSGGSNPPDEVYIEREGGDRDRGGHVERVVQPEFPAFRVGEEHVLFLRKAGDMWWPAYGPDSAFRLSRGRIEALGTSKIAVSQHGKPEEEFLGTVRDFGIK